MQYYTCTTKQMTSRTQICIFAVFETDGEADDRMLGQQPGLPPDSPAGQKDTCQNVRITGYQAVRSHCQLCKEWTLTTTLALVQPIAKPSSLGEKEIRRSQNHIYAQNSATQGSLKTAMSYVAKLVYQIRFRLVWIIQMSWIDLTWGCSCRETTTVYWPVSGT